MRKYTGMPELLEQFMDEEGTDERWVTVQELRDRFGLTRYQCNTVSGFLRRLEYATFGSCPYIVMRIEHVEKSSPSSPATCRYLIRRRGQAAEVHPRQTGNRNNSTTSGFPAISPRIS